MSSLYSTQVTGTCENQFQESEILRDSPRVYYIYVLRVVGVC